MCCVVFRKCRVARQVSGDVRDKYMGSVVVSCTFCCHGCRTGVLQGVGVKKMSASNVVQKLSKTKQPPSP